jgi:hypothetical protein
VNQDIDRDTFLAQKENLLAKKKWLQESIKKNENGQMPWLEPCPRLQKSPWFLRQSVVTTRRKLVEWWSGARGGN